MTVKLQIAEIAADETDGFWERFMLPRRPVVIRGLFAGEPLAEADTAGKARGLLGDMPVLVQDEYTRQIDYLRSVGTEREGDAPEQTLSTLGDYLDGYGDRSGSQRVVTEWDVPASLLSMFTLPDFCRPFVPSHSVYTHMFMAGPDNWAHLHFDMDQAHVLLVQIFGRKGVTLFPPSASRWLHPFGNYGSIRLQAMDHEEREAFVTAAGGAHTVIGPTDAIYMPPLLWHYLDYLDLGASFNIRFGRNPYSRFLSVENFLPDQHLQAVAEPFAGIAPGAEPEPPQHRILEQVIEAYNRDYESREDKYRALWRVFRNIHGQQDPEDRMPLFIFPLDEETERYNLLRLYDNFLYRPGGRTSWEAITATAKPASAVQLDTLDQRLKSAGNPRPLIDKVLFNKFGKTALSELTREEASRLLGYLGSPSGSLSAMTVG
jgi:hypothetical protein